MYVFITEISVMILGNSLKLIDVPYFTTEFAEFTIMNSEY